MYFVGCNLLKNVYHLEPKNNNRPSRYNIFFFFLKNIVIKRDFVSLKLSVCL